MSSSTPTEDQPSAKRQKTSEDTSLSMVQDIFQGVLSEIDRKRKDIDGLNDQLAKQQEEIDSLIFQGGFEEADHETEVNKLKRKISDLEADSSRYAAQTLDLDEANERLEVANYRLVMLEQDKENQLDLTNVLQKEREDHLSQILVIQQEKEDQSSRIEQRKGMNTTNEQRAETVQEQFRKLLGFSQTQAENIKMLENEKKDLQERVELADGLQNVEAAASSSLEDENQKLNKKVDDLQKELDAGKEDNSAKEAKIQELEMEANVLTGQNQILSKDLVYIPDMAETYRANKETLTRAQQHVNALSSIFAGGDDTE